MAKLIYTTITSLDGYIEDEQGKFDWVAPDDEVHAYVNDLKRPVGTYLYGRRMYETMVFWETVSTGPEQRAVSRDYAEIWRAAEKIVYSRSLGTASSSKTRIEREFKPESIRALKQAASRDISIGGPELAAVAFTAGLIDELHLFAGPVLVGGGKRALPLGYGARLTLLEERRFQSGVVHLQYRVTG
jgi:dihydrofolate reductase